MANTVDLRTYLLLERAFVRRLQRSWKQYSAPIYAKITQACLDHNWNEARRLVPDLDMAEVGTDNREWITYMLLSCAVFGANTVSKRKPSFVGVGTFDTFLKQTTSNILQYLEFTATARVQKEALQLIATDEAEATRKVAFDPSQPRDEKGRWTGLPAGYTSRTENTAYYSGQSNFTTRIYDEQEQEVAHADYTVAEERYVALDRKLHPYETRGQEGWAQVTETRMYRPEVSISMIEVNPDHRRKGLGMALLRMIAKERGLPIRSGMMTDEGSKLWQAWLNRPERLKWEESKHPRDKQGQFTESGAGDDIYPPKEELYQSSRPHLEGGGGPEHTKYVELNEAAMEAFDVYMDARDVHNEVRKHLEVKYGATPDMTDAKRLSVWEDVKNDPEWQASFAVKQKAQKIHLKADADLEKQAALMRKEVVTNLSTYVAEKMGVSPRIIDVVDKDPPSFKVGEKEFNEAGHYDPSTGRVEINARNASYGDAPEVKGLTAHELSHAIFHSLKLEVDAEHAQYLKKALTPDGRQHTDWYKERFELVPGMTATRRIKSEYREELYKEFPAAATMAGLADGQLFQGISQRMVDEDGHSAYARSYWTPAARVARGGTYDSAINETIAELTRWLTYPGSWHEASTPQPSSPWVKLTVAMHKWYAEKQRQQRSAHIAAALTI